MRTGTRDRLVRRLVVVAVVAAVSWVGLPTCQAAGLLVAEGGSGGVLTIEEHTVDVVVNNGIAVTTVNQVFRNTENRQVEALYTFPVPKSASVANFSMWINGQEMVGEVVEKKRARQIYESYKQVRRDPGLLEQTDYRTFEMRIFPIAAGARQRVQVAYYQELDIDHNWATYVYPLATTTRSGLDSRTSGKFSMTVHARSEVPIAEMASSSHAADFALAKHGDGYFEASLETKEGDLNRDVVLAYRLARPKTGIDLITSKPANEDGYFCMMLTVGDELQQKAAAMDYLFILDISGSMAHDGKLAASRESVLAFVNGLGNEDRFDIVTFSVQPAAMFNALTVANEESKARAAEFMATRKARGGTVLRPALQAAYRYADADRTLNVVILSDGMTEQGERAALVEQIRARPSGVRVFCVGVGNEVNRPLLKKLAGDAGGLCAFLSQGDNFERQAKAFRRKLVRPVATDLKITFAGTQVYDVEPTVLPNLYHGMPVRLYGRYRGGGEVKVHMAAEAGGAKLNKDLDVTFPKSDDGNPEIERMWAWHRVQRLAAESGGPAGGEPGVGEIVRLGEGYSIATEHTSFIVLENDAEYKRWQIQRRNALRIKRDRKAQQKLRNELDSKRIRIASNIGPTSNVQVRPMEVQTVDTGQPAAGQPQQKRSRAVRRNWDLGPFKGGGPVEPVVVVLIAGVAGASWWRRRRAGSCSK